MKLQLFVAATIAAWALSACSTMNQPMTDHPAGMNAEQQCAMYRKTMDGKSAPEQRAAAAAHITAMHGSADDAHIDRHLRMMGEMCGGKPAAGVIGR